MPRIVTLVVLIVFLLVIGALFFQVIANFLLPIFLALVLAVVFDPLYGWLKTRWKRHERIAAAATTAVILLIVLLPILVILGQAAREGIEFYREIERSDRSAAELEAPFGREFAANVVALGQRAGFTLTVEDVEAAVRAKVQDWIGPVARVTAHFAGGLVIGLFVTVIALYYFLADGVAIKQSLQRLSPLDSRYENELIGEFQKVCRAVVTATLLSAIVQGMLAGVGFYFAGTGAVFLLTFVTMLLSMVPFFGAVSAWVPVCLWLFFHEGRTLAALLLAVYCASVVSTIDNVIKPLVLHGRSNIHPLLALLSVLGGVQALGPIGIFVGPMVVAFLHALLKMVQMELARIHEGNVLD